MNVNNGQVREVTKDQPLDENEVLVPPHEKTIAVMSTWGSKKRQAYANLVEAWGKCRAFYIVEYNNGKIEGVD